MTVSWVWINPLLCKALDGQQDIAFAYWSGTGPGWLPVGEDARQEMERNHRERGYYLYLIDLPASEQLRGHPPQKWIARGEDAPPAEGWPVEILAARNRLLEEWDQHWFGLDSGPAPFDAG